MARRDYVADMTAYIKERIPEGDYVTAKVAKLIFEQVKSDDPDLLSGWLMACGPSLISRQIGHARLASHATARRSLKRERFAAAAAAFSQGNPEPLKDYLNELQYRTAGNVIKKLGNLTSADCRFIASTCHEASATYNFEAVFMDALARKVPEGVVRDHLTDEQVAELRSNVADAIQRRSAVISA